MADIPELSGPNAAADKNPNAVHVRVGAIKSDKNVVGGVVLGSIDQLDLSAEKFNRAVDEGVSRALTFKPVTIKIQKQVGVAARLRQDALDNASAYVVARGAAARALWPTLRRQDPTIRTAAERRSAVSELLLERVLTARFSEMASSQTEQLANSRNLYRFQTTVGTTFMRQTLALNYRQLYATNNLISLTKAFADMVENKLEAIKINTKLPDSAKPVGIFRRIGDAARKEVISQVGKAVVSKAKTFATKTAAPAIADYLGSTDRPNLRISDRIGGAARRAAEMVRTTKVGSSALDAAQSRFQAISAAAAPFVGRVQERAAEISAQHNLAGRFNPDLLWQKSAAQRQTIANMLRSLSGTGSDKLRREAAAVGAPFSTATATEGSHAPPSHTSGLTRKDVEDLITSRLDKIQTLLEERLPRPVRANGFAAHNARYRSEFGKGGEGGGRGTGGARRARGLMSAFGLAGHHGGDPHVDPGDGPDHGGGWVDKAEGAAAAGLGGLALKAGKGGIKMTGRGLLKAGKLVAEVGPGAAAKIAGKGAFDFAKIGAKDLIKVGVKKIPLVGLAAGTIFALQRAWGGDWKGAGMEMSSGITSIIPGWGTGASLGIDGALLARDIARANGDGDNPSVKLLAARMQVYGAMSSQTSAVKALEARVYPILIGRASALSPAEETKFAQQFGFTLLSDKVMSYFRQWMMNRFLPGFQEYVRTLAQHNYTLDKETTIPEADVVKILDSYMREMQPIVSANNQERPTPEAFSAFVIAQAGALRAQQAAPRPRITPLPDAPTPPTTPPPSSPSAPPAPPPPAAPGAPINPISYTRDVTSSGFAPGSPIRLASYATEASNPPPVTTGATVVPFRPLSASTGFVAANDFSPRTSVPPIHSPVGSYSPLPSASGVFPTAATAHLHFNSQLRAPGSPDTAANDRPSLPITGSNYREKSVSIMRKLMADFHLTQAQAAGIVGNLGHESGGFKEMQEKNPLGGGRGGLGWAQWTGPRRVEFEAYSRAHNLDPNSDEANYGFLKEELTHGYKSTLAAVRSTNTPGAAMMAFEKHYEAAGIKHYGSRQRYTDMAMAGYATDPNGAPPPGAGAPGAPPGAANVSGGLGGLPKGRVGSGQCVDLVKASTGLGHTSTWKQGPTVLGNPDLKPGMAIATFDPNGTYGNHVNGASHAAIYLGPSTKYPGGIRVYDQWAGHPAQERDIRPAGRLPVDSANAYSIIGTETKPAGVVATAFDTGPGAAPPGDTGTPPAKATTVADGTTTPPADPAVPPAAGATAPPSANAPVGPPATPPPGTTTAALQPPPNPSAPGPAGNLIAPMRTAMLNAQVAQRPVPPAAPAPPPASPGVHPDLLVSTRTVADTMQKLLDVNGNMHDVLQGLHSTTKDAYGDKGVFAALAAQASRAGTAPPVIAPTINHVAMNDKKDGSDDGLSVSKKRDPRYAA